MTKQVNTLLSSRLVSIERQCCLNAQYFRRECLDIEGIPSEVEADNLEEKVVAIFEKLGCNIPTERLKLATGSVKRTTQSLSSFHQGRTASRFGMSGETYLVKTSCSSIRHAYQKVIWAKRKKLHSLGKIHSILFWVAQLRLESAKIVPRCL